MLPPASHRQQNLRLLRSDSWTFWPSTYHAGCNCTAQMMQNSHCDTLWPTGNFPSACNRKFSISNYGADYAGCAALYMALHHPEPAWPSETASKAFVECWNAKRICEYKWLGGTAASKEAMRVRLLDALTVESWANSTWPRAVRRSFTIPKVTRKPSAWTPPTPPGNVTSPSRLPPSLGLRCNLWGCEQLPEI